MNSVRPLFLAFLALATLLAPTTAAAQGGGACCILPDAGDGSASLPPDCAVGYTGSSAIIDGLPIGSPVQIAARLRSFTAVVESPGGTLGGEQSSWNATLDLVLTGTGVYLGYNRFIAMPVSGVSHAAPRVPFAPVQAFAMDLWQMQGQITLDPDFDLLRVTAGGNFGMPSPGQTVLTSNGGGWEVNSYIDLTHRIDFVGNPVGNFAGRSGSTTHVHPRFEMCYERPTPAVSASWGGLKATYR